MTVSDSGWWCLAAGTAALRRFPVNGLGCFEHVGGFFDAEFEGRLVVGNVVYVEQQTVPCQVDRGVVVQGACGLALCWRYKVEARRRRRLEKDVCSTWRSCSTNTPDIKW